MVGDLTINNNYSNIISILFLWNYFSSLLKWKKLGFAFYESFLNESDSK
ncbi:hypothetical protein QY97_01246 [Bacillus thermotolerans]|nr:hypothetical protein QY97_01246 [Bacillus thermotolerans]